MAGAAAASSAAREAVAALHERGEKLANLDDKFARFADDAEDFAAAARKLRRQQESGMFGLGFGGL